MLFLLDTSPLSSWKVTHDNPIPQIKHPQWSQSYVFHVHPIMFPRHQRQANICTAVTSMTWKVDWMTVHVGKPTKEKMSNNDLFRGKHNNRTMFYDYLEDIFRRYIRSTIQFCAFQSWFKTQSAVPALTSSIFFASNVSRKWRILPVTSVMANGTCQTMQCHICSWVFSAIFPLIPFFVNS